MYFNKEVLFIENKFSTIGPDWRRTLTMKMACTIRDIMEIVKK